MITESIDYVINQSLSSSFAICTYWIPLIVCAVGYFIEAAGRYRTDLVNCVQSRYTPTLTYGRILATLFITLLPVVNLFTAVFNHSWSVARFIGKVFDIPLVSHKPDPKAPKPAGW